MTAIDRSASINPATVATPAKEATPMAAPVPMASAAEFSLDRARFDFIPRTISEAFDTALLILRSTVLAWLPGYLLVSVFSVGVIALAHQWPTGLPMASILLLVFGTAFLGVVALGAMFPALFGERPNTEETFELLTQWPTYRLILRVCLWRLLIAVGLATCVIPGLMLGIHQSFTAENRLFRRVQRKGHDRRTSDLVNQHLTDLLPKAIGTIVLTTLMWALLFLTLDTAITLLLGIKVFLGRLELLIPLIFSMDSWKLVSIEFNDLLFRNPVIQSEIVLAGFAAYLIGRTAWFLTYIDLRVRVDCWDMELHLLHDALRLVNSSPSKATAPASAAVPEAQGGDES